ncbi:MAG: sulfite exporter TauE/SafE family protein [Planktomarina sp.]
MTLFGVDISLLLPMFAVALVAGTIKGVVGFALPLILVTGLTFFVGPELAVAALLLPTLITNGWQALRQGKEAAIVSIKRHWKFMAVGGLMLLLTTQTVPRLNDATFYLLLGVMVTFFALVLLSGWMPSPRQAGPLRAVLALIGGFTGGIAAIWGPPTVAYLSTFDMDRKEFIRVQGIVYGLGALVLVLGHSASGLFTLPRMGLSAVMLVPTMVGIWIGTQIQDRINQKTFRTAVLMVLVITGLNMIRRGIVM